MTDPTCAQLIEERLASRLASIGRLVDQRDPDTGGAIDPDDAYDQLAEYPLDIDRRTVVVVLFGTGGPHDELRYHYSNPDAWTADRIEYHYADWFDGATVTLNSDQANTAEQAFGEVCRMIAFDH